MRDTEFLAAIEKMAPILSKRFHFLAKRSNVMDDRKSFVEDLVALTTLEALLNSRNEIHRQRTCEQLIRIKAKNVWADYCKKRDKSFDHPNHAPVQYEWIEDRPLPEEETNEKIDLLLESADEKLAEIIEKRLQGFRVNEIAAMHGVSEGAISMQIQRLKQKIQKRP